MLDIRDEADEPRWPPCTLSLTPFRRIVKDYFTLCESYFAAIKTASPSQIEAIDMGRRGLHNEGSELLRERLAGQGRDGPRHRAAAVHPDLRPAHPGLAQDERRVPTARSVLFACTNNAVRSPMAEGC